MNHDGLVNGVDYGELVWLSGDALGATVQEPAEPAVAVKAPPFAQGLFRYVKYIVAILAVVGALYFFFLKSR